MRVRVLFGVASVVAVVGMLWGSVTPARACQCVSRTTSEYVDEADTILIGDVTLFEWVDTSTEGQPGGGYIPHVTFRADRYLKGSGSSQVTASWEWCDRFTGSVGDRYVAFLRSTDGKFTDSPCFGSSPIAAPWPGVNLAEVAGITGPGVKPDGAVAPSPAPVPAVDEVSPVGSDSGGFPVLPVAIAATLGPLAFLVGAAFFWRPSRASG